MRKFREILAETDWTLIDEYHSPTIAYSVFLSKYKNIYNDCFPLKKIKPKNVSHKPWLSKALPKSIKKKNKLYKQYIRIPILSYEIQYKIYKNKLNHTIRFAKRLYYQEQLLNSKSNIKTTWRILNEIINKKSKTK